MFAPSDIIENNLSGKTIAPKSESRKNGDHGTSKLKLSLFPKRWVARQKLQSPNLGRVSASRLSE